MTTSGSINDFLKMQAASQRATSQPKPVTAKSRVGQRWSTEEEQTVLQYVSEGRGIKEIADLQGRSFTAISLKLKAMAVEMYKTGDDLDIIVEKTGLTVAEVADAIREGESGVKSGFKGTPGGGLTFEQGNEIIALLKEIRDLTLAKV